MLLLAPAQSMLLALLVEQPDIGDLGNHNSNRLIAALRAADVSVGSAAVD